VTLLESSSALSRPVFGPTPFALDQFTTVAGVAPARLCMREQLRILLKPASTLLILA
jgi:hypothetical protein